MIGERVKEGGNKEKLDRRVLCVVKFVRREKGRHIDRDNMVKE
jgi:hypothetical protein